MSKLTVEQGKPRTVARVENDLGKVARFLGKTDPAELTDQQIIPALQDLGHDSSIVVWESGKTNKA